MPSILKVNQIQKTSSTSNIINKSGSTITLGSCGTTVTLACGATSTGFGATSFVDWCTTAKTAPFTGAAGAGYFVNTSCGAITVTLPATPTAGDIVSLKDYGGTWATNNVTLCGNSSKINGVCATATLNTNSQSVTLIYVDATKGWQDIQDSTAAVSGNPYIVATGGTVTTCGDYKVHTFTADATFTVCSAGTPTNAKVDYLVVAGGGGGGTDVGGGGGAGGFRLSNGWSIPAPTMSPLSACVASASVTAQAYPITVGGGGTASLVPGYTAAGSGGNSVFSTITSTGGGAAGASAANPAQTGGSGGGGAGGVPTGGGSIPGAAGNTPPVSPPQGNNGGSGVPNCSGLASGGGGGASAVGVNALTSPNRSGAGGAGSYVSPLFAVACAGTPGPTPGVRYFGGGGGGGSYSPPPYSGTYGAGGVGGGGPGGNPATPGNPGVAGTTNTGGGGGGGPGAGGGPGGAGGSGIVILRYRYQ
jgi:hypothetical protein